MVIFLYLTALRRVCQAGPEAFRNACPVLVSRGGKFDWSAGQPDKVGITFAYKMIISLVFVKEELTR
jgi:hypothetical protein